MALECALADQTTLPSHAARRAVDRALSDLRHGEPVMVTASDDQALLVLALEAVTPKALNHLANLAGTAPVLVVTEQHAKTLSTDVAIDLPVRVAMLAGLTVDLLRDPSDLTRPAPAGRLRGAKGIGEDVGLEAAATILSKIARLRPAIVAAKLTAGPAGTVDVAGFARRHDLLSVRAADILDYHRCFAGSLVRVAEAAVPLEDAERTRIIAFRPFDGGPEHLAIVIGDPTPGQPVLVRLHSECFTGDLLGALRCGCSSQLRGAIREVSMVSQGIVLYLAQEGRGVGLMDRMRACRRQGAGLGMVDADEWVYLPAAHMLNELGFRQVRLLTSNPYEMNQLSRWGVDVVECDPHFFPANGRNRAYPQVMVEKLGH